MRLLLEQIEIDRLTDKVARATFPCAAAALVVAIGGHHHDRQIRPPRLDLTQQGEPIHPRHVDFRQNRDQLGPDLVREPVERFLSGGGKMQDEFPLTASRRNSWRNRSATSGSSSTTRMLTLMMPPLPLSPGERAAVER